MASKNPASYADHAEVLAHLHLDITAIQQARPDNRVVRNDADRIEKYAREQLYQPNPELAGHVAVTLRLLASQLDEEARQASPQPPETGQIAMSDVKRLERLAQDTLARNLDIVTMALDDIDRASAKDAVLPGGS